LLGWLADRVNVRWLYPAVVLVWSAAGFATGFVNGFMGLLTCRFVLGLAESGHWPCALRTTQRILPPEERTLGNSILQSGASAGAVLTPLVALQLYDSTGSWRYSFQAVSGIGFVWVVAWLCRVRSTDLAHPTVTDAVKRTGSYIRRPSGLLVRRFIALFIMVISINATWHFFRAWLPLFLKREHGYTLEAAGYFTSAYYIATDIGALCAGFATLWLARRGSSVYRSRMLVYLTCALLTSLSVVAARLPHGWPLLALLLVVGFGSLGVFPAYYSFSQELTVRHQGMLTGVLSCGCWLAMALLHELVGKQILETGSYRTGVALAGFGPLIGFVALVLLWGSNAPANPQPESGSVALERDSSGGLIDAGMADRRIGDLDQKSYSPRRKIP
jgi:ACS family hexuronate transporter-like MFS transporter